MVSDAALAEEAGVGTGTFIDTQQSRRYWSMSCFAEEKLSSQVGFIQLDANLTPYEKFALDVADFKWCLHREAPRPIALGVLRTSP